MNRCCVEYFSIMNHPLQEKMDAHINHYLESGYRLHSITQRINGGTTEGYYVTVVMGD